MDTQKFLLLATKVMNETAEDAGKFLSATYEQDEKHNALLDRATKACKEGYYLESITLSVNVLNGKLKRCLFWHSILSSANKYGAMFCDEYLYRLLMDDDSIFGKLDDRKLYDEVKRIGMIDGSFASTLHGLYSRRNALTHRLASNEAVPADVEFQLARDYLGAVVTCFDVTIQKLNEISAKARDIKASISTSPTSQTPPTSSH